MRMILQNVEIVRFGVASSAEAFEWNVVVTYASADASMSKMRRWTKYADAVESCKDIPDSITVAIHP